MNSLVNSKSILGSFLLTILLTFGAKTLDIEVEKLVNIVFIFEATAYIATDVPLTNLPRISLSVCQLI